jgi:hypothetical protein
MGGVMTTAPNMGCSYAGASEQGTDEAERMPGQLPPLLKSPMATEKGYAQGAALQGSPLTSFRQFASKNESDMRARMGTLGNADTRLMYHFSQHESGDRATRQYLAVKVAWTF